MTAINLVIRILKMLANTVFYGKGGYLDYKSVRVLWCKGVQVVIVIGQVKVLIVCTQLKW